MSVNVRTWLFSTYFIIIFNVITIFTKELSITGNAVEILDTSYPILIHDGSPASSSSSSTVPSQSFFGFSVSLTKGNPTQVTKGWIFIGSPKSNASNFKYAQNGKDEQPGVIWRCSLGKIDSTPDACEIMKIDPGPRPLSSPGIPKKESHNNAWIGVVSEINHGKLVTCGMLWNRGENQFYNGICYWFAKNPASSQQASYLAEDLSKLVQRRSYDHRLTPFYTQGKDLERLFNFTNRHGRPENAHEWQLSEAGLSVHLFKNLESDQPNLLIGAPGVRQWSGAVVLYTNEASPKIEMQRPNRNPTDSTFSEFVILNRGIIPEKELPHANVFWDEYFGYSVSSGKYLSSSETLYAAGAPRAEHCGTVVIFRKPKDGDRTYKRQIETVVSIKAPENSFASYFGSVIYSVDLDGDGLDELIVGAPFYTLHTSFQESEQSSEDSKNTPQKRAKRFASYQAGGDQGGIFVYKFNGSSTSREPSNIIPAEMLTGSQKPGAKFGSAITSLLFNYTSSTQEICVVVGAPFEPSQDGSDTSGAIYLYLYNKVTGKFGAYSQRIGASRISVLLNGFGNSLSIPDDIDQNNTPDVAIGSFKSGHAVVLRTRPKISLQGYLSVFSEKWNPISSIQRRTKVFHLKSCFYVKAVLGHVKPDLDIWTRIRFIDETIKFQIGSKDSDKVLDNQGNSMIFLTKATVDLIEPICTNITIEAVNKFGIGMNDADTISDILHPFMFYQEIWYNETLNEAVSVLNLFTQESHNKRTPVNFDSFNPLLPSINSSTSVKKIQISISDCKASTCRPNISMTWSFYHPVYKNESRTSISNYTLGSTRDLVMEINIANTGETAENMKISFDWNVIDITESLSSTRWLNKYCTEVESETKGRRFEACNFARYILTGRNKTITIVFDMGTVFAKEPTGFQFKVNAQINFGDPRISQVRKSGHLKIEIPPTNISIFGSTGDEALANRYSSYYITKSNSKHSDTVARSESIRLNEPIRQTFTIKVLGASVKMAVAKFQIPVAMSGGNKQFFLVKQPYNGVKNINCKLTESSKFPFHLIEKIDSPTTAPTEISSESSPHEHKYFVEVPNNRRRRDITVNTTISPRVNKKVETKPAEMSATKKKKLEPPENAFKFMCVSENDCLDVSCEIQNLKANSIFHIPFELFPVKDVVDELLKNKEKSTIFIRSNGTVQIFTMRSGINDYHDLDTAETVLTKRSKNAGVWIYFAAAGGGIFVLAFIVVALYKCGFFKREKKEQLNHMKAEHHRKSMMMAAARASIMIQPGGTDGFDSKENLTEAEHRNEDTEDDAQQEKPELKDTT